MTSTTKITAALIGVLVVGGIVYALTMGSAQRDVMAADVPQGEAMMEKDEAAGEMMGGDLKTEGDEMMKDDAMNGDSMMQKGSYEPYAAAKLAKAASGNVVLFFRASWCPTCKAVDSDIRAHLSAIPAGLTILDVDYDNSTELKKKYGVTYQHTFVQVAVDGTQIKKWSGSPTLSSLVGEVQ